MLFTSAPKSHTGLFLFTSNIFTIFLQNDLAQKLYLMPRLFNNMFIYYVGIYVN